MTLKKSCKPRVSEETPAVQLSPHDRTKACSPGSLCASAGDALSPDAAAGVGADHGFLDSSSTSSMLGAGEPDLSDLMPHRRPGRIGTALSTTARFGSAFLRFSTMMLGSKVADQQSPLTCALKATHALCSKPASTLLTTATMR